MFRKENHCLVQYIVDKYGDTAHKFAIGLKAFNKDKNRRKGKGRRCGLGGGGIIKFLATLATLPRKILKNRMNSSYILQIVKCKTAIARQGMRRP